MSDPIAILYEDERGEVSNFPLHALVVRTVADLLGQKYNDIKDRFEPVPKKGNSKLLHACGSEVPRMPYRHMIAIFDADKLHRLLQAPGKTPRSDLHEQLRRRCSDSRLSILLLEENTESLVEAAAKCLERDPPERKSKTARDKILNSAAFAADSIRACIRDTLPSFAAIVEALATLASPT